MMFRLQKGWAVVWPSMFVHCQIEVPQTGAFCAIHEAGSVESRAWGGFSSWFADDGAGTVSHMPHLCRGDYRPPTLLTRMGFQKYFGEN